MSLVTRRAKANAHLSNMVLQCQWWLQVARQSGFGGFDGAGFGGFERHIFSSLTEVVVQVVIRTSSGDDLNTASISSLKKALILVRKRSQVPSGS